MSQDLQHGLRWNLHSILVSREVGNRRLKAQQVSRFSKLFKCDQHNNDRKKLICVSLLFYQIKTIQSVDTEQAMGKTHCTEFAHPD